MNNFSKTELAARVKVAGMVISSLLLRPPNSDLRFQLTDPQMLDGWPLTDDQSLLGVEKLRAYASAASDNPSGGDETMARWGDTDRDYLYLLRGVGRPLAEPHESARLSVEHLVFEEQTLKVRQCYQRLGFQIDKINTEPDDHIGYEISFLSEIAGKLANAYASNNPEQLEFLRLSGGAFLRDHLDRFFDDFVTDLQTHAQSFAYQALPALLRGWRNELERLLA